MKLLHIKSEVEQDEVRKRPTEQNCLVVEVDQETEKEGKGDKSKANATRNRVVDGAQARSVK